MDIGVNFSKVSVGGGAKRIEGIEEIQIHAERKILNVRSLSLSRIDEL